MPNYWSAWAPTCIGPALPPASPLQLYAVIKLKDPFPIREANAHQSEQSTLAI